MAQRIFIMGFATNSNKVFLLTFLTLYGKIPSKKGAFIMIRRREIALTIILSIVTCGIYGILWMVWLNDEINLLSADTQAMSGGMVLLLSLVTCGIYAYVWLFQMGTKLDNIEMSHGRASQSRGILYLVLALFGLGIVSYALMQDTVNNYAV